MSVVVMGTQGSRGPIALVGGAEFLPPARPLDSWLLERSGSKVVTVVPTAARAHPEMAVATARRHFAALGGTVEAAMILTRDDAEDPESRTRLGSARFIYLAGGEPPYLRSVLEGTPSWAGILDALGAGGTLAGSSAGAMVLCDRMLIPGSPATRPGLGLVKGLVVLPHFGRWRASIAQVGAVVGAGSRVLGVEESTGLVLEADRCHVLGAGSATLYRVEPEGPVAVWTSVAPAELEVCL